MIGVDTSTPETASEQHMATTIINIFGGPGIGKTTFASDLFGALKRRHVNVELTREYAKDLIWNGRSDLLSNQLIVLGGQLERLSSLNGRVELIVSDSPLLLCSVYAQIYAPATHPAAFHETVAWADRLMPSVNLVLSRLDRPYQAEGRIQDESGARDIDALVLTMLNAGGVPHLCLPAGGAALAVALAHLEQHQLIPPAE